MLTALALAGCTATGTFHCEDSSQCRLGDTVGFCESNTTCSFADNRCSSGRRFDDLGLPGLAGTCVEGGSITLASLADGHVDQGAPTMVFGTAATMKIDGNATKAKRAFARFDLASLPPRASVVTATLTVCITNASGGAEGHQEDLQMVTSGWDEATLTWNTQPFVSDVVTTSLVVPAMPACFELDVSADARAQAERGDSFGWSLRDHDETVAAGSSFDVGTRENTNPALRPGLVVTYSLY